MFNNLQKVIFLYYQNQDWSAYKFIHFSIIRKFLRKTIILMIFSRNRVLDALSIAIIQVFFFPSAIQFLKNNENPMSYYGKIDRKKIFETYIHRAVSRKKMHMRLVYFFLTSEINNYWFCR